MPKNGYWIECVPISSVNFTDDKERGSFLHSRQSANLNVADDLYAASTEQFPDLSVTAPSPDAAIEQLRQRLKAIRDDYQKTGKLLPALDNPVDPPRRLRKFQGWISVYIEMVDV